MSWWFVTLAVFRQSRDGAASCWGMTRAKAPRLGVKQQVKTSRWQRGCLNWQAVRYSGVNLSLCCIKLWGGPIASWGKTNMAIWSTGRIYSSTPIHMGMKLTACLAQGILGAAANWSKQQAVQTPYIFKPKGRCRNLLCGLASTTLLAGVMLVLLACLQEELCGPHGALWS